MAERLLTRDGYDGLTIEAVAVAAEVGRPTIYRRWPDKAHLVLAIVSRAGGRRSLTDTGSLRGDLLAVHREQARLFNSKQFRTVVPALLGRLATDEVLARAYRADFVDIRRQELARALDRAMVRGEIGQLDVDDVFDRLCGPLFYRVIVRGRRVDSDFARSVVDGLIASLIDERPHPVSDHAGESS